MRKVRAVSLGLLVFAAAVFAAGALGLPIQRPDLTTTSAGSTSPSAVVVKRAWMLPAGSYKWVQPVWIRSGGVLLPRLPSVVTADPWAQPPAWMGLS